jgi:hypothetical protein
MPAGSTWQACSIQDPTARWDVVLTDFPHRPALNDASVLHLGMPGRWRKSCCTGQLKPVSDQQLPSAHPRCYGAMCTCGMWHNMHSEAPYNPLPSPTLPLFPPFHCLQTEDGIEQTLGIDYFAPVLLTFGLLPLLRATTNARIIMMASPAEMFGKVGRERDNAPSPRVVSSDRLRTRRHVCIDKSAHVIHTGDLLSTSFATCPCCDHLPINLHCVLTSWCPAV